MPTSIERVVFNAWGLHCDAALRSFSEPPSLPCESISGINGGQCRRRKPQVTKRMSDSNCAVVAMKVIIQEKLVNTIYSCIAAGNSCKYIADMSIHRRIKERRQALGLSMENLAGKVGRSWQSVQLWEKEDEDGGTAPTRTLLPKVAEVLLVTSEWLLTGKSGALISDDKYFYIPRLQWNMSGEGSVLENHEEVDDTYAYRKDWLVRKGLNAETCKVVEAPDDSMEGRIQEGDVLLIDTADTSIKDGKVYALNNGKLRVKRLFVRFDGQIIIRSDKSGYPEEIAPPEAINIIGRVVGFSGGEP